MQEVPPHQVAGLRPGPPPPACSGPWRGPHHRVGAGRVRHAPTTVGGSCLPMPPGSGPPWEGPVGGGQECALGHDVQLSRDRLDELFRHCADLSLNVEWSDLGDKRAASTTTTTAGSSSTRA